MSDSDFNISNEGVKAYLQQVDEALLPRFMAFVRLFQQLLPEAELVMKYGMPTFFKHKSLVFLAVWKHHVGIYPHAEAIRVFADELRGFKCSKGAIQIPHEVPIPEKLLQKIALYRREDVEKQRLLVKSKPKKSHDVT